MQGGGLDLEFRPVVLQHHRHERQPQPHAGAVAFVQGVVALRREVRLQAVPRGPPRSCRCRCRAPPARPGRRRGRRAGAPRPSTRRRRAASAGGVVGSVSRLASSRRWFRISKVASRALKSEVLDRLLQVRQVAVDPQRLVRRRPAATVELPLVAAHLAPTFAAIRGRAPSDRRA